MVFLYILVRLTLGLVATFLGWRAGVMDNKAKKYRHELDELNNSEFDTKKYGEVSELINVGIHKIALAFQVDKIQKWWMFYQGWADWFGAKSNSCQTYKGRLLPYLVGKIDLMTILLTVSECTDKSVGEWLGLGIQKIPVCINYLSEVIRNYPNASVGGMACVLVASVIAGVIRNRSKKEV